MQKEWWRGRREVSVDISPTTLATIALMTATDKTLAEQVIESAVQRASKAGMTMAIQSLREWTGLDRKTILGAHRFSHYIPLLRVDFRYGAGGRMSTRITFSGAKIPIYRFRARTIRRRNWVPVIRTRGGRKQYYAMKARTAGVRYRQPGPTGGERVAKRAFLATFKSGHTGAFIHKRGKIVEVKAASLATIARNKMFAQPILDHIKATFEKRVASGLSRFRFGGARRGA